MAYVGIALVAAGFAFKVAAVPFHMWTPDVYEGAPTPVTALMSAGVKAAAFASMVRVFLVLGHDTHVALAFFSVLALLTMVGGNLLALPQRNVKRMLAYPSIAHAGYLLVGVAALFVQPGHQTDGLHLFSSTGLVSGEVADLVALSAPSASVRLQASSFSPRRRATWRNWFSLTVTDEVESRIADFAVNDAYQEAESRWRFHYRLLPGCPP